MKRWMRILLAAAILCMTVLPAWAETAISIPVTVSLTGTLPSPAESFTIRMRAASPECPMPGGREEYVMEITGAGTRSLPALTFSRVGVYTYTISQDPGAYRGCVYDATVYRLIVTVTNAPEGGLEAAAAIYPVGKAEKTEAIRFRNAYPAPPTAPAISPKTGDAAQPGLYAVLAALGLAVLAALAATRKPKNAER